MEPVTHALTSIALGRVGLNRLTRTATPMLLASGLVADVDLATRFWGARAFLHSYRTATHSLVRSEEQRLNSSHSQISYAVFCLKKKKTTNDTGTIRNV